MKLKWSLSLRRRSARKTELEKKLEEMGANESQRTRMQQRVTPLEEASEEPIERVVREDTASETEEEEEEDLSISFGYQFRKQQLASDEERANPSNHPSRVSDLTQEDSHQTSMSLTVGKRNSSFSCLSGAALSANATLANTALGNGLIGEEILPGLDSPRTFRKLVTSTSTTILELSPLSPQSDDRSPSTSSLYRTNSSNLQSNSAPNRIESTSFLNAPDVQTAGGAAGEDRVQAVCSEENGWLFCGIYDGFNGRDAADFLAGTFYQNVGLHLRLLEWHAQREHQAKRPCLDELSILEGGDAHRGLCNMEMNMIDELEVSTGDKGSHETESSLDENFRQGVMQGLERAFIQTESDFMEMVEQEMDERPELVMVGSCMLAVLMHGPDLYTLNLGDSRAVLATTHPPENSIQYGRVDDDSLWAVQMTESHVVNNPEENKRILTEHPDDASAISGGRLKGKLLVTRAFGAGYLKNAKMNNALMGILRVRNLFSPPYLGTVPCVSAHRVSVEDSFVVLGSDGLFDFFTNEELVDLVHHFVRDNPTGDPAKYMLEQLLHRAAENAGMTVEQLKGIPIGRRRKYHDDVTIIVISLAEQFPTSTASTVSAAVGV